MGRVLSVQAGAAGDASQAGARLVAGLMYLQHVHRLSDDALVAQWLENPCFQHFTGETFFQHRAPIHPSSLSRWRDRIGEEGAEWLLTKTIAAGRAGGWQPQACGGGHDGVGKEHRPSHGRAAL